MRGAGQEETIINGYKEGYPVVRIGGLGDGAKPVRIKLEAVTISGAHGGCADWQKGICANGMLIRDSAEVEIADSTIAGNKGNSS